MKTTARLLNRFCKDQDGATAAEYVLILAIIGAGLALAAIALGGAIANGLDTAGDCIADSLTCDSGP